MPTTTPPESFITVAEIAQRLKVNELTVRAWIDRGELRAVRAGRRVRVRPTDLEAFLTAAGGTENDGTTDEDDGVASRSTASQLDENADLVNALQALTVAVRGLTETLAQRE